MKKGDVCILGYRPGDCEAETYAANNLGNVSERHGAKFCLFPMWAVGLAAHVRGVERRSR